MVLEINSVSKSYSRGKIKALDDFTATLTPGVYGLLGPNGAGKSTLMNIITDNISRDTGNVVYNGTDILKLGKQFRNIVGYMPQQQGLYNDFTGLRFLWYMAALKGLDRKTAKKRIETSLQLVNLSGDAVRKIGGYSGGMKQRLLIAQALLNDPEVLILDEPTAGLDPKERVRIRNFISEIASDKIVIFATHVVSDIESIAKEIIILKQGKLQYMDTVPNLLKLIKNKVYEVLIDVKKLPALQKIFLVSNVYQTREGIIARILSDYGLGPTALKVQPQLEDLYLYLFGELKI